MARYRATVETKLPRKRVFDYLSDFSTTEEWDPGVVEGERLGGGPVRRGSEFRVVARFMGRNAELTYRVTDFDPPHLVTLRGENGTIVSLDTITFEPRRGGGTRVTYDAKLELKGPLKLADPLLGLAFKGVGERALEGLRNKLSNR